MCYNSETIIREFKTANFRVVASIEPDQTRMWISRLMKPTKPATS